MTFQRKLALAVLACAFLLGGGGALAQGPKAGPQRAAVKAAAAYIGVTIQELRQELQGGNSLATVALEHDKTVEGLEAAIVADAKAHLDKAVAAGKLTAEKEAQILQKLQSKVVEFVMRTKSTGGKGAAKGKGHAALRGAIKATAAYVGLTEQQVLAQLKAGKSLADVATAQGKTVDGLKAAILADAKTVIDRLVSQGKISAERGQQYLARLQAHIDQLVTRTRPAKTT
jgi:polyhydroxyalkanoate synthesis regulator phasin